MVKVLKSGKYQLIETKQQIKILYLDKTPYVWLHLPGIGHVLEHTNKPHKADHILSIGSYRLYDVEKDERYSKHKHLELFISDGVWQGYILLTGLPNKKNPRTRIVATREVISAKN